MKKTFPDERIATHRESKSNQTNEWEREDGCFVKKNSTLANCAGAEMFFPYASSCVLFHCFVVCKPMPERNANVTCPFAILWLKVSVWRIIVYLFR